MGSQTSYMGFQLVSDSPVQNLNLRCSILDALIMCSGVCFIFETNVLCFLCRRVCVCLPVCVTI